MKIFTFGGSLNVLVWVCLMWTSASSQSPVAFSLSNIDAEIGENVCLDLTVEDFTAISSIQIPVKWSETSFSNVTLSNEALSGSFFNVNNFLGELRYLWDDPSLENPVTLDNNSVLFTLCFDVIGGKGMDEPIEIVTLENPEFEALALDSELEELDIVTSNGLILIADDCNGVAILPETICQNQEFTVTAELSAMGLAISNFGHWKIDGVIVDQSYEGNNFPNSSGNIEVGQINSLFDDDYKEELFLTITDTEPHTFQYVYDFINCIDSTEEFVLQALPQPESIVLDVPANVCYDESFVLDLDIEQEGTFDLSFSINGMDSLKTVTSENDTLLFENIMADIQLNFNVFRNSTTNCVTNEITPNDTLVSVLDEFEINLIDTICNDNGSYMATYQVLGGSGDYALITDSNGELSEGEYFSGLLMPEDLDTVTIIDQFCQSTGITFVPDVLCSCVDSVTEFSLAVLISCQSGEITPVVERAFVSASADPVTYFQIYSKSNGVIDEILFDSLTYQEDNPVIPHDVKYESGRTYFALPVLSERVDGEIDFDYRCISIGQEIRFRYYDNPKPEILGETTVCTNQLEVKYDPSTNNSTNEFIWNLSANADGFPLGNSYYVNYGSDSPITLDVEEVFRPDDIAGDIECRGDDLIQINITSEVASEKIAIILFPGGILSADGDESLCYQWATIEKSTGLFTVDGPADKIWLVGEEIDTDNFVYVCIVSNPVNGNCEASNCPTYNYFNSTGPIATEELAYEDLILFPNPTDGNFFLQSDEFTGVEKINLYDSFGNEIQIKYIWQNGYYLVDLASMDTGVYFVSVRSKISQGPIFKKIVKF